MSTLFLKENFILTESGIRNINKLRSQFDDVVIITHQDLDGVTSAIGMKYYFERYGFNVFWQTRCTIFKTFPRRV